MLIALLPVIVMVVGLLMYGLAANGKVQAIGLSTYTGGAVGFCVLFAGRMVRLL